MALLGIDVGTSGCKTIVVNENSRVLSSAFREYLPTACNTGYLEIDPENVWLAVADCIRESVSVLSDDKVEVLSVSSFGEAAVPIDRRGRVLYNGILLTDPRGSEQAEMLAERMGNKNLAHRTGLPLHPMYTICRVMWLRKNNPVIFKEVWKFLQFEDFIIYRLTDEVVTDYTLASRSMAFNVLKNEWDEEILDAAGLPRDIFAHAQPSGTSVGKVRTEVACKLGLSDRVLVVTGGHDQPCAALGAGVTHEGSAIDGIGTSECVTTCFDKPVLSPALFRNNYHCGPHVMSGKYITFAYTMSAGSLLQWFRDVIGGTEREEALNKGLSIYTLLDSRIKEEPTKLLVLPHFAGSGTPYLNTTSSGAILGLNRQTTTIDIYKAMLESITFEMRYNLECLEEAGIRVNTLRAVGGGAKSDAWMQIKSDILNRPVATLEMNEAGTMGVVMLAGVAVGIYRDLDEACRIMVREKRWFEPDPTNAQRYEENYQHYKRLYAAVNSVWK